MTKIKLNDPWKKALGISRMTGLCGGAPPSSIRIKK